LVFWIIAGVGLIFLLVAWTKSIAMEEPVNVIAVDSCPKRSDLMYQTIQMDLLLRLKDWASLGKFTKSL
jgi:hypothetical protein